MIFLNLWMFHVFEFECPSVIVYKLVHPHWISVAHEQYKEES